MDDVANNPEINSGINSEIKEKMLGGITGKGFMPGVSGNPSGRPKGSMKDYLSRKFAQMSDEEREQFLLDNKVDGKSQIEFAEGKAKQDLGISGELTSKVVSVDE